MSHRGLYSNAVSAAGSCCADVFLWFVAAAVLTVLFVFDSPAIDYRFVALGGVLPLAEALTGRPLLLHTLLGSVLVLTVVMAATVGRRVVRRRLLGIPIGTFVFLVASASWTRTKLFWWPAAGFDGIADPPVPEFDRPIALLLVMELGGVAAVLWLIHRLDLKHPSHRRRFVSSGRLPREHLS